MTSSDARALNSARALGDWVRNQIDSGQHENDHSVRVITQETDRWFKNGLTESEILAGTAPS